MFQGEETESANDSKEKHAWCAEKIEKRLNGASTKWVGRRMVKYEVRKVAGKPRHNKDTDFYSKWESIRGSLSKVVIWIDSYFKRIGMAIL